MLFIGIGFVINISSLFSCPLDRRRGILNGHEERPKRWREDRSSHKWMQRAVHVLLQRLLQSLSPSAGSLFVEQFRSPQDWKIKNPEEIHHAVPPNQKELLWTEVKAMFTLPERVAEELVKKYALKEMAQAFSTFKKKLF
jgi:hypothetical protein